MSRVESDQKTSRWSIAPSDRVLLLPAAGWGTRANLGPIDAKEMLPREGGCERYDSAGRPLIELFLQMAIKTQVRAHVITRAEKKSLTDYLQSEGIKKQFGLDDNAKSSTLSVQTIEPTKDWPETLLRAQEFWGVYNVVCLPDTDFLPNNIVQEMFAALENSADIVFATFQPEADRENKDIDLVYKTWGVIGSDVANPENYYLCEKPQGRIVDGGAVVSHAHARVLGLPSDDCKAETKLENIKAWGFFGFRRACGAALLSKFLSSVGDHSWQELNTMSSQNIKTLNLSYFADLTRQK